MPEGLVTEDGQAVDLGDSEQAFAQAMAAPAADEPEHPAPPEVPPFDPEAPYGRKLDGTPKKRYGGRPPKDKPRVQAGTPAVPEKGKQAPPQIDYTKGLQEFFGGIAMGLAVLPIPKEEIRVRCRVQAKVLQDTGDGLAGGLAMTADHNGMVRWAVDKMTQGGGAWVFPAALAVMPFAVQTAMVWRSPIEGDMVKMADEIETSAMEQFKAAMGDLVAEGQAAA